jgi:hypothetical protein
MRDTPCDSVRRIRSAGRVGLIDLILTTIEMPQSDGYQPIMKAGT